MNELYDLMSVGPVKTFKNKTSYSAIWRSLSLKWANGIVFFAKYYPVSKCWTNST